MESRTIKELVAKNNKAYVYLVDEEMCKQFFADAEAEGFTFGDGAKPTEKHCSDIIAVNADMTISYVTTNGRIAFGSGADNIVRVDYQKYLAGDEQFDYKK